jgi:hypothetical protein
MLDPDPDPHHLNTDPQSTQKSNVLDPLIFLRFQIRNIELWIRIREANQ